MSVRFGRIGIQAKKIFTSTNVSHNLKYQFHKLMHNFQKNSNFSQLKSDKKSLMGVIVRKKNLRRVLSLVIALIGVELYHTHTLGS